MSMSTSISVICFRRLHCDTVLRSSRQDSQFSIVEVSADSDIDQHVLHELFSDILELYVFAVLASIAALELIQHLLTPSSEGLPV